MGLRTKRIPTNMTTQVTNDAYSPENLQRMRKGLAPIVDNAPMELHHTFGRKGANFYIFEPVTKAQHHFIHYRW